jgi:hypothetical protein
VVDGETFVPLECAVYMVYLQVHINPARADYVTTELSIQIMGN